MYEIIVNHPDTTFKEYITTTHHALGTLFALSVRMLADRSLKKHFDKFYDQALVTQLRENMKDL